MTMWINPFHFVHAPPISAWSCSRIVFLLKRIFFLPLLLVGPWVLREVDDFLAVHSNNICQAKYGEHVMRTPALPGICTNRLQGLCWIWLKDCMGIIFHVNETKGWVDKLDKVMAKCSWWCMTDRMAPCHLRPHHWSECIQCICYMVWNKKVL